MSSQADHLKAAAALGALFEFVRANQQGRPVRIENLFIAAAGGALGGRLPDVIEPPIHSHHRDAAHSVAAAAGVTHAVMQSDSEAPEAVFLRAAGVGYVTHLVQDAGTPRSIPLLARRIV